MGIVNKWKLASSEQQQGVCHIVGLPFTLKKCLNAKEELWKLNISPCEKHNFQKKTL